MSVSKWAYDPEKCDGDFCVGDCDLCPKAEDIVNGEEQIRPSLGDYFLSCCLLRGC